MNVRLHGTAAEVAEAAKRLREVFDVARQSPQKKDRDGGGLVRVYVEVALRPAGDGAR